MAEEGTKEAKVGGQDAGYLFEFKPEGVFLTVYPTAESTILYEVFCRVIANAMASSTSPAASNAMNRMTDPASTSRPGPRLASSKLSPTSPIVCWAITTSNSTR